MCSVLTVRDFHHHWDGICSNSSFDLHYLTSAQINSYVFLHWFLPLCFRKYPVERKTHNLKVPYFVKEEFHIEYKGSLRRIERQVEEEYISNLRANCFRERSYSEYCINYLSSYWIGVIGVRNWKTVRLQNLILATVAVGVLHETTIRVFLLSLLHVHISFL